MDVARASALCLYALKAHSSEAERILFETLEDANAFNRWTAAQTLAFFADVDSRVIQEIVSQMMDNNEDDDPIKNEQVGPMWLLHDYSPAPFKFSAYVIVNLFHFIILGYFTVGETFWGLALLGSLTDRRKAELDVVARPRQSLRRHAETGRGPFQRHRQQTEYDDVERLAQDRA